MRRPKIYLETTLFNYYFDTDRDAHPATVALFEEVAAGKYDAYTSTYVLDELGAAPEPKRTNMLNLISRYEISLLSENEETIRLANLYIKNGLIPEKYRTDGLHIAMAAVSDLDIIISLNFQHIVKRKTKLETSALNALNGYRAVEILTPMEVVDYANYGHN
ncbi:MAG: hypothetical protein FWC62_01700 [Firmicutes bacterium]|nr:hypothetical protein [Bacillota bacterium]